MVGLKVNIHDKCPAATVDVSAALGCQQGVVGVGGLFFVCFLFTSIASIPHLVLITMSSWNCFEVLA